MLTISVDASKALEGIGRASKRSYVAGRKRPVVITTIGTTKGLGVRKMSAFIEKVISFGANDLNVKFSETKWENHR